MDKYDKRIMLFKKKVKSFRWRCGLNLQVKLHDVLDLLLQNIPTFQEGWGKVRRNEVSESVTTEAE